ncbi:MAG: hypothetical protein ACKV19_26160 [Verrucomicrobiales bacterium]
MSIATCFRASLCLALGVMALPVFGQGTASQVIGYYRFNAPAGVSLWTCALTTKKEFQGQSTSVTAGALSTISQSGAGWTPGAFNLHYVEIVEGSWAGLVLDITQNTATTVQVEGNLGAAGFNLGQNVKYAIRKHATLGSIFRGGAGLRAFSDSVTLLYDNGTRKSFFYDDTPPGHIVAQDFVTISDNEIVYPAQGILLNCNGPRTLTFGGGEVTHVKDTPTKVPLYAGKVNFVGQMNPVVALSPLTSTTIDERSGLGSPALGLADSALTEYADLITLYGRTNGVFSQLGLFYYDLGADTIVTTSGVPTNLTVPHGVAFTIKPTGNRYYTQPPVSIGN